MIKYSKRQIDGVFFLYIFYFPQEKIFLHFIRIVFSSGDNLHEMSKLIFWNTKTKSKYQISFLLVAWTFFIVSYP